MRFPSKSTAAYILLLAGAYVIAVLGSRWFGEPLDRAVYDEVFRVYRPAPWQPESVLLAIDERSLDATPGGVSGLRQPLAAALRLVAGAHPKAVAVDVILANPTDPAADAALASALRMCPNLVLASQLLPDESGWEDPIPQFRSAAAAVGHVHSAPDADAIVRSIPLMRINRRGIDRRWAISLEALRLSRGAEIVEQSGRSEVEMGGATIPAVGAARLIRVRFPSLDRQLPRLTLRDLLDHPDRAAVFTGKVVFAGVTAQTEHDKYFTPYSQGVPISGVAIHADAFETMAHSLYITDLGEGWIALFAVLLVAAAGASFRYLPGWRAYVLAALFIVVASAAPYAAFSHAKAYAFTTPIAASWLGGVTAAGYYHLVTRRSLKRSEAERARYQQAMHFVTHEMRTPLSAIQGSSELISRFALTEEKRKQVALLINSESKRLARMVEIFLNVERLSAGQMELKRETIAVSDMVSICVERTRPLAERKHITINLEPIGADLDISGDRELLEYACYNLLTNAVKYSPQRTEVTVTAAKHGNEVRISIHDQGIGMDQKEVKLIFRKFYRTKKAEQSGEAGTGIGLSIVQQIVEQHGGEIEVTSEPGKGSCFTLVMPAATVAPAALKRH